MITTVQFASMLQTTPRWIRSHLDVLRTAGLQVDHAGPRCRWRIDETSAAQVAEAITGQRQPRQMHLLEIL